MSDQFGLEPCNVCDGLGRTKDSRCTKCHGTGNVYYWQQINFDDNSHEPDASHVFKVPKAGDSK